MRSSAISLRICRNSMKLPISQKRPAIRMIQGRLALMTASSGLNAGRP